MKILLPFLCLQLIVSANACAQQGELNNAKTAFNNGITAYKSKQYANAYHFFDYYRQALPDDTTAIYYTALAATKAGKTDPRFYRLAIANYNKLLTVKFSGGANIYLTLSSIYRTLKDTAGAVSAAEEGVARYPANPYLRIREIEFLLVFHKKNVALEKISNALEHDPQNKILYYYKGAYFAQAAEEGDVLSIKVKYEDIKTGLHQKAIDDYKNAVDNFKIALQIDPNYFEANLDLGRVLIHPAIALFKQAKLIPKNQQQEYKDTRLKADELFNVAKPYLVKAKQLSPSSLDAIDNLINYYEGKYDPAHRNENHAYAEELKSYKAQVADRQLKNTFSKIELPNIRNSTVNTPETHTTLNNGSFTPAASEPEKAATDAVPKAGALRGAVVSRQDTGKMVVGKYYALIIGIQNYQDRSIQSLDEPIEDASALYTTLKGQYTFDNENITFLKNPTRKELFNALDALKKLTNPNDNILIFYAGHGDYDAKHEQGYWYPADAERDSRATWVTYDDLKGYFRAFQSKHTFLISDACFSGAILKTRSIGANSADKEIKELYGLRSRKAMTSGEREVPDKSVFIQYLVKRLNQNTEKYITAEELFSSLRKAVIDESPDSQIPEFGEIREAGDEGGDFIFIRRD